MGTVKKHLSDLHASETIGLATETRCFNEVLKDWSDQMDVAESASQQTLAPASEDSIDRALRALKAQNWADGTDLKLRSMVSNFPYPTFIVMATGRIVRMNEAATQQFTVLPDDNIDHVELATSDGRPITDAMMLKSDRVNAQRDVRLISALRSDTGAAVTLAIVPTDLDEFSSSCSLIFVIEKSVRKDIAAKFGRFFELTNAEECVLVEFLDGKSLQAIADETSRSIKTLRTQFHAIMGKVGVNRQADLVSKVLTMSHFLDQLDPIAKVVSHPHRRRFDLLRPGPRTVEVFLAGDLNGALVIVVPSVTMRTFPAELEEEFRKRRLCVATVCRPGYGGTDPALPGQTTRQCFGEDVKALMDQLNVSSARVVAQNTGSGYAVGLASDLPDRILSVLLVSAMPPAPYLTVQNTNSKLSRAFIRARKISPKLFRLLMHLSIRAWKTGGIQRVHGRQMSPFLPDLEILKQPDVAEEFDDCMRSRFAQDLDLVAEDFEMAVSDWSADLISCPCPISILHGTHDQAVAITDIHRLRDDFPDKISLIEIENAGFMLPYSHRKDFLAAISSRQAGFQAKVFQNS